MEEKDETSYAYEERFVAFIDILGFKDSISNNKATTLIKTIQLLRSEAEKKPLVMEKENYMVFMAGPGENNSSDKFHTSREISVFSDLIVISYAVQNEISILSNLHKLLHSVYFIQEHLAESSILIRGGITCGDLYHKGDICIGPALIRAYELESKIANFPRVVLDPAVILQERFKRIIGRWPDYLEQFEDDLMFITHFKPLKTFFDSYSKDDLEHQLKFRRIYIIEVLYAYKLAIERALNAEDIKTVEKGEWLKKQYLQTVKYFESHYIYSGKEKQYIDLADV